MSYRVKILVGSGVFIHVKVTSPLGATDKQRKSGAANWARLTTWLKNNQKSKTYFNVMFNENDLVKDTK